jgi:hypothetical protein
VTPFGRTAFEEKPAVTSFELSPGVVVDRDRSEAYVMNPDGAIVALDLAGGKEVWRSRDAAKPLAVSGDLLISQAEAAGPNNELAIVALRTGEGTLVTRTLVDLPPTVQPAIDQTANRAFMTHAEPGATEVTVSWEFVERPLRGIAPGAIEVLPGEEMPAVLTEAVPGAAASDTVAEPGAELVVARGAVRLDPAGGIATPLAAAVLDTTTETIPPALAPSAAATDLPPDAMLPGVPGPQFLSADGAHVLTSDRVDDDSVWDKYVWSIFDRATGNKLGEVRSHVRVAPFFVNGSQVVYQVEPFARRVGDTFVEEPVQIRSADLQTGQPLWSHAVRDTVDRTAPPP